MTKHLSSSKAKRYTAQGLLIASVVGLGVTGVLTQIGSSAPAVAAQAETSDQTPQALELSVYSNAMQVRRAAGLADKDLAALGLDEAEATAVLDRLVSWCEVNERTLHQMSQTVYQAKRELADQQRLVRIGQATEQQRTDADGKAGAVENAEQAYADLLESGAAQAMQAPGIGAGKADAWERSASLKAQVDSDLRYLPSMNASRMSDLAAESKQRKTEIEQELSFSEQRELASVRGRFLTHLPGIHLAVEAAMPLPVELQPVPEEVLAADREADGRE